MLMYALKGQWSGLGYITDLTTESVRTIKFLFTFAIILLQKFMKRKTNL